MPFTDEDLKLLKAFTQRHAFQPEYTVHTANGVMNALLSRLEAAEACIPYAGHDNCDSRDVQRNLEAWRKATGKL